MVLGSCPNRISRVHNARFQAQQFPRFPDEEVLGLHQSGDESDDGGVRELRHSIPPTERNYILHGAGLVDGHPALLPAFHEQLQVLRSD